MLGFLFLPFYRPAKTANILVYRDIFVRYYTPYIITLVLFSIANALNQKTEVTETLLNIMKAIYSGSAIDIETASSMSSLWFLPSLTSMVLLYITYSHCRISVRWLICIGFLIVHPFIGMLPGHAQSIFPIGLIPAVYAFPLALITINLNYFFFDRIRPHAAFGLCFIIYCIATYWQILLHLSTEVGFGIVATLDEPFAILINDATGIFGFLSIYYFSCLASNLATEIIGRYSLPIYLYHQIVFFIISRFIGNQNLFLHIYVQAFLSFLLTVFFSFLFAHVLFKFSRIRELIFPKDWNTYKTLFSRRRIKQI